VADQEITSQRLIFIRSIGCGECELSSVLWYRWLGDVKGIRPVEINVSIVPKVFFGKGDREEPMGWETGS